MAEHEISQAILLRRVAFRESSWILVWLTRDHGKLRTAARGTSGATSRFRGRLDLFFEAEIHWAPARRGDLHQLREVHLLHPAEGLRTSYGRLLMASYCAELLDRLIECGHPAPGLHDLLGRALRHLDTHEPTRRAVEFFEQETARLLGLDTGRALVALEQHAARLPASRGRLLAHLAERT